MIRNGLSVDKSLKYYFWSKHPRIPTNVEKLDLPVGNSAIKR